MARYLLLLASLATLLCGCERQSHEGSPEPVRKAEKHTPRVVVPEEIEGQWEAVRIAVFDKDKNRRDLHTVTIGSEVVVAETGLRLKVKNFLPAFIMDGSIMTSASSELKNPAAQVEISEGDKHVFRGWLFSRYPGTHAYHHPRYSFTLVDFVPVGEKRVDN